MAQGILRADWVDSALVRGRRITYSSFLVIQGAFLGLVQPYIRLFDHLFLKAQRCSQEGGGSAAQLLGIAISRVLKGQGMRELAPCGKVKCLWLTPLPRDLRLGGR
jgi:hypothetical protein